MERSQAIGQPVCYDRPYQSQRRREAAMMVKHLFRLFIRRYGVALLIVAVLWADSAITAIIVRHNTTVEVTEQVTSEMRREFQDYLIEQEQERQAASFMTGDASLQAAMDEESDAIARVIGTMTTKRMKQTMIWNILVRVDSPFYPNNVKDVVGQPQQWMFYDEKNPIRDDDKQLALEQLKLWHEGRYPAGLSANYVYGEWSTNDYVLRDNWEKNSKTNYWRFPE